jgi:hypothetical protein
VAYLRTIVISDLRLYVILKATKLSVIDNKDIYIQQTKNLQTFNFIKLY